MLLLPLESGPSGNRKAHKHYLGARDDLMVEFLDFDRSPCGRAECLMLSIMVGEDEIPMGAVTDNECFGELLDALYGGMVPVFVVEDEELEVYRRGRTMYAALTTGVGFIHPVSAEFKVCSGKPEKGMESMPGMTMTYISYEAVVHFVYDGDAYTSTGLVVPQFLLKMTPL